MPFTVGFIGCGGISARHLRGFGEHPDCRLAAVADVRRENAEARAAAFGVEHIYTDYRELLERHVPDIVSINTWTGTHAEITIAAARAGVKGILCEKPIARDLAEVDAMLAACDAAGTRLAVGHHARFEPRNVTARRLIAEGAIGRPLLLHNRTEGGLLNNSSHAIDRMRYLLGDVEAAWVLGNVARSTDRYERGEPCEDCCGGIVAFRNGARGVLESDLPRADWEAPYQVYGAEGTLCFADELELLDAQGRRTLDLDPSPTQHEEFVAWLRGECEMRTDVHGNRHTVEIEMALYESARRGGAVPFPLEPGPSPLLQMIEEGRLVVTTPGRYDIRAKP